MLSDVITQTRLSMRLDAYLSTYTQKHAHDTTFPRDKWDTAWEAARVARSANTLTPEIVDDVRIALNRL